MQKSKFCFKDMKQGEKDHGCYFIDKKGQCWPNLLNKSDNFDQKETINPNDVIFVEYDPIEWKLRFRIN